MSEPIVYLKGRFVPASQAAISIYDFGIVLGATLTEMTRTFKHRPYRVEEHIARLYRSCKYAGIEVPLSQNVMLEKTVELVQRNCKLIGEHDDLGVIHFITPGECSLYAGSAVGGIQLTPTICIHSFPLPLALWRRLFERGAHVVTPSIRHVPPQCVDPKMKNRSRLHWYIADGQSHNVDPQAISLLLDLQGNVTECSGANFVIIAGDTIVSPAPRNILRGVSLMTIQELAPSIGMKFVERDFQPFDVVNADEAWLTTTPYCLAACTKINNIAIGEGSPGPQFAKMLAAFSNHVGLDVSQQILEAPEIEGTSP